MSTEDVREIFRRLSVLEQQMRGLLGACDTERPAPEPAKPEADLLEVVALIKQARHLGMTDGEVGEGVRNLLTTRGWLP